MDTFRFGTWKSHFMVRDKSGNTFKQENCTKLVETFRFRGNCPTPINAGHASCFMFTFSAFLFSCSLVVIFLVVLSCYRHTSEFQTTWKKLWKQSATACVPTEFAVSLKLPPVFQKIDVYSTWFFFYFGKGGGGLTLEPSGHLSLLKERSK